VLQNSFERECDRLSAAVDTVQFERLRWARTEGPMLARLVELTTAAIGDRSDYELAEEGSSGDIKRFVLKVHGTRVVAVAVGLVRGLVVMDAELIDRSRFRLAPGDPVTADYAAVDEDWIGSALQQVFARIQA
jgi:hypothetical protein